MPTLNKRLLLRLLVIAILSAGGLFGVHYAQSDQVAKGYLWQAENAASEGQYDKSILWTRQYLELKPQDHETATRLGELILKKPATPQSLASVLFLYEKILREDPARDDVREKLVDISLRLGRFSDARTHAEAVLAKRPGDGRMMEIVARAAIAQNQNEAALDTLKKAVEATPENVSAHELLAQTQFRVLKQVDAAAATLDTMVRLNPNHPEAFLVRARWYRSREQNDACMKDLERVLLLDPENIDALLMNAELLQVKGNIHRARLVLNDAMGLWPMENRVYRSLSWLELSLNNNPAALAILEEGIRRLPNDSELLTPFGDLLLQTGNLDRVREIIAGMEKRNAPRNPIGYLQSRLLMQENKWASAYESLEKLRIDSVVLPAFSAQVCYLQSVCQERLGNRELRLEALQRVLALEPTHSSARLSLGNLYLGAGRWDDAVRELTIATRAPNAAMATHQTLIRLRIARAKMSNAAAPEWKDISDQILALQKKYAQSADPVMLLAQMYAERREYPQALTYLRENLGAKVNDGRMWVLMVRFAEASGGLHAALDTLDEARNLLGETVELRLARAGLWAGDVRGGRAARLKEIEDGVGSYSDADQIRFWSGMAELYSIRNDHESLTRVWRTLASRMPTDISIRRAWYEAALAFGDDSAIGQARAELVKMPNGASFADVQDRLAKVETLSPGDVTLLSMKEQMGDLLRAAPERADVQFLLGRVADRCEDKVEAAKRYELAVELEGSSLKYLQTWIGLRLRTGDEAATAMLSRAYYDIRLTPGRFQALLEGATKDLPDAGFIKAINSIAVHLARDPQSLLTTAEMLRKRNRPADALKLVRLATGYHPTFPDAWAALVSLLPADQSVEDELRKAAVALPSEKYAYVLAESTEMIRTLRPDWQPLLAPSADLATFSKARFNVLTSRGQTLQAKAFLDQLSGPAVSSGVRAWADQTRTLYAAIQGDAKERAIAADKLVQVGDTGTDTIESLRAKVGVVVLTVQNQSGAPRAETIRQVIALFKRICAMPEATAKDWYGLAQFYQFTGDATKYRATLQTLREKDPKNLFYVVAWAEEQMKVGQLDSLAQDIELLSQAKNDLRAVTTVSRWYALKNDAPRAIALLDEYVAGIDAGSGESRLRLRQVANQLDQLARQTAEGKVASSRWLTDAAIDRYKMVVRNYPETLAPMLALLAFDNRTTEAFEILTRQKATLTPKALATAGMAILRAGNSTDSQFAVVTGWLNELQVSMPDSTLPTLSLAELHSLKHDYAAAEVSYRAVLKIEPKNIVALNNLAWILSPKRESGDAAMAMIEEAIRQGGTSGELLDTRSRIFMAANKLTQAKSDLDDALSQSKTPLRYFHLAVMNLREQKQAEAKAAFKEAMARGLDPKQIHPSDLPTYRALEGSVR